MKIAFIGASGNVGSKILSELLERGHEVTAIMRHPEKLAAQPNLTVERGDINEGEHLTSLLKAHEAILSSVHFSSFNPIKFLEIVKQSGVPRLLVVGGAGSLEVAPGVALIDSAEFPDLWKPEAAAGRDFLKILRAETLLDWTFLSPSALIEPGERTGHFRLGTDQLLTDANGDSRISTEDYAIAFVDELERPKHSRQRFTVGY